MRIGLRIAIGRMIRRRAAAATNPTEMGAVAAFGLYSGGSDTYQDAGATTPAAAGDPVAYIEDYIGGYHATTSTDAERPVLNAGGYVVCDRSDDALTLTVPSGGWTGDMVWATTDGVEIYGVNIPAGSHDLVRVYQPGDNFIGAAFFTKSLSSAEKNSLKTYYTGKGAGDFSGTSDFDFFWRSWDFLTSMPAIQGMSGTGTGMWFNASAYSNTDLSGMTRLSNAWNGNTGLSGFNASILENTTTGNFTNAFNSTSLTESEIDAILAALVTANVTTGTRVFSQSGGAAPSSAGEASIDVLYARGWTVSVTGGYAPSAPAFSTQPSFDATGFAVGNSVTFDLGAGPSGTTITVQEFLLDAVDKSGELSGTTWDSTGESDGTVYLTTRITDDVTGLFTDSNQVSTNLYDVPDQMSAPSLVVDSDTQITATLAAAPDDNGSAITQYGLRHSTDESNWTTSFGVTSPVAITGLTEGTALFVQTRATNAAGPGSWSASATETTDAHPAVSALSGTTTSDTTATWAATSDTASGTIYAAVREATDSVLSISNIENGTGDAVATSTDASPTADATNGGSFTGLTAETGYKVDIFQRDAGGYESDVVSSMTFTTNAAGVAPSGTISVFGPQSGDDIPITISSLSEDAPDSYWILTSTQQTIGNGAGELSSTDVRNGDIGDGTDADDDGAISLTVASPSPSVTLTGGLDDDFYTYVVLGDAGGNYSDPIEAGPIAIDTTVAASGSSFIESLATASITTSHNLVLTSALAAGDYLIGVANLNGASQISSVSLEGTSTTQVGSGFNANSKSLEFHSVTVAGGGNKTVNVAVTSGTNRVVVTVWKLGDKTYQGEDNDGPPHASGPHSADIQFTTSAGDEVFVISGSNTAPVTTMTNLTQRAADVVVNGRHFNSGDNLAATGGSPETFSVDYSAGFDNEDALGVHYA